ncbi:glycosyl transferase family 1, partial [Pseudomonas aeruginosa]
MRVLHFYKTYLSETVGGIEQVIFQLCESSGPWGIDNHVLTLSSDPHPPVVPFGGHVV